MDPITEAHGSLRVPLKHGAKLDQLITVLQTVGSKGSLYMTVRRASRRAPDKRIVSKKFLKFKFTFVGHCSIIL
jgi:hypothetical protein